ncbi:right-handed parallel beta-helix repeat-containing protein [Novosphingobium sp. FSY-8]|uniref:Right-handed parallel beta-helix repeat-containing protein n=2 Tax=Novosphingobium ovatum TaxID=1908523 RepID=A0ABW9XGJ5_9SPHN|nr:right-handed parallel beta-helix repeat-containing protein [Novosphingobium ovatum]
MLATGLIAGAALWAGISATAQPAAVAGAPFLVVETGQRYQRLQDALFAIGDAMGTIRIAPGIYADCGVQEYGHVAYVAALPGRVTFNGRLCEGKAALVLRGRSARVEGIIFSNLRAADGNGAGIRLEKGNLAVAQAWFRNSEEGILAGNDPKSTISIDRSSFTHLGRCDRGLACSHSIYINFFKSVRVTNSRFEAGDGGHYLKVRAAQVAITDNSFDDTLGRGTNYLIDLPAGATGRIAGNWLIQGSNKENPHTLIAVAAESRTNTSDGLTIEGNVARFANPDHKATAFVADWSGHRIVIGANQLEEGIARYVRR